MVQAPVQAQVLELAPVLAWVPEPVPVPAARSTRCQ
jgi:hypothetical protein